MKAYLVWLLPAAALVALDTRRNCGTTGGVSHARAYPITAC